MDEGVSGVRGVRGEEVIEGDGIFEVDIGIYPAGSPRGPGKGGKVTGTGWYLSVVGAQCDRNIGSIGVFV